jgi:hypothetical protein
MKVKSPAFSRRLLLALITALLVLAFSCAIPILPETSSLPATSTTIATSTTTVTTKLSTTSTTFITSTTTTPTSTLASSPTKTIAPTTSNPPPPYIEVSAAAQSYQSGENITRRFDWEYKGCSWWYEATLSTGLYQYLQDRPRLQVDDWAVYATHPGNEWLTKGLADVILRDAPGLGYSDYDIVECAVVFAQQIPYTLDADSKGKSEWPRFPIETVVDDTGDCEDHAILLAAVTHALGYDTVLLDYPTHMAVGIAGDPSIRGTYYEWRGKRFYFVETTSTGWVLGELPEKYQGVEAKVIELIPKPVYFCTWSYPAWRDCIPLTVEVENRGSAPAEDVVVHAGCDAGENMVWNQVASSSFNIPIDDKATVQLSLVPPRGQHTRVVVWVTAGGQTVHKSESDNWFDIN